MPIFSTAADKSAHRAFVDWIETHPNGFVLNVKGPQDVVLHRATCGHFKPYNWANQANHRKACSIDRAKLEHWAEVEGVDTLGKCSDCL